MSSGTYDLEDYQREVAPYISNLPAEHVADHERKTLNWATRDTTRQTWRGLVDPEQEFYHDILAEHQDQLQAEADDRVLKVHLRLNDSRPSSCIVVKPVITPSRMGMKAQILYLQIERFKLFIDAGKISLGVNFFAASTFLALHDYTLTESLLSTFSPLRVLRNEPLAYTTAVNGIRHIAHGLVHLRGRMTTSTDTMEINTIRTRPLLISQSSPDSPLVKQYLSEKDI